MRVLAGLLGALFIILPWHALIKVNDLPLGLSIAPLLGVVLLAYAVGGEKLIRKIAPRLVEKVEKKKAREKK
jgi:peptidoglycan/LPS O-acetylase OafA/YrhL